MNSLSEATLTYVEKVERHPNADKLDLATIYGCTVIVGRDEFRVGDECVFVPFDSICPLDDNFPPSVRGKRVKPAKIRGVFSIAIALKNKWGLSPEDNVNEKLGITKYEWTPKNQKGRIDGSIPATDEGPPPQGVILPGKYDIENLRRYHSQFTIGEHVYINEKIHGTSSRYLWVNNDFFVGSRNRWYKKTKNNKWWNVAEKYQLEKKLKSFPKNKMDGIIIFGEVYGSNVQDMSYGAKPGELFFSAFDLYNCKSGKFADYNVLKSTCEKLDIPMVPEIYNGPWLGLDKHKNLAEQDSMINNGISEGFVARPVQERHNKYGRCIYKLHSERFLLRS